MRTERRDPFADPNARDAAARIGMGVFLIVVSILFVAAMLGYAVVRLDPSRVEPLRDPETPGLPHSLLLSTGIILASSVMLHRGLLRARRGESHACARALVAAYWMGVLFVLLQGVAWWVLVRERVLITDNLYAWTFYVLTALHAVHIIGGLIGLERTVAQARLGAYTPSRHNGIVLCAMYWHTLAAIWLVLYATLWVGS